MKDRGTKHVRRPQAIVFYCDVLIALLARLYRYHLAQNTEICKLYPQISYTYAISKRPNYCKFADVFIGVLVR